MRSPSIDLLRALRSAILAKSTAPACRAAPQTSLRLKQCSTLPTRPFTTSCRYHDRASPGINPYAPKRRDRGPPSNEDTQTDFAKLDILGNMPPPANSVDACTDDGFHLNNGIQTTGGSGVLLLGGEAFLWRPWTNPQNPGAGIGDLLNKVGVLSISKQGFGVLDLLYPKPDLLIVGTGNKLWMLSKETRAFLTQLGIRVDVMDTANAAAAYNLLATERGVQEVGAAFLPVGWEGNA